MANQDQESASTPGTTLSTDIGSLLARNIAQIESGGQKNPYAALGPMTSRGRAIGKYQVMPFNVGPWTKQALGTAMTPEEFRNSPQAQEAVMRDQITRGLQQYSPRDFASVYFTGRPYNVSGGGANDRYTTNANYVAQATAGLPTTEGSIVAAAAPTSSLSPAMINTPMGPSTSAPTPGGTSAPAVASATPTGPPTSVGDLFGRLTTPEKDAQGNEKPGSSPLDKAAKPFQQNKDAMAEAVRNAPNMMQPPPDTSAQLAPAAQQLMASTLANASRPLTWSSAPYGSGMAGQQMGSPMGYPMSQGGIQQPQIPGLTLNSLQMGMGYYG